MTSLNFYAALWIAAVIIFAVIEFTTFNLVSIWFAFGSVMSLVASYLGFPFHIQAVTFVIFSGIALAALRPFAKEFVVPYKTRTNADRVLDMTGVVQEKVDNTLATGSVYVDGKIWTARSESGKNINEGERVIINRIEGVKLFVTPKENEDLQNSLNN